jgi:uncharacterized membrane protein YqgA involved in biofilm formation
MTGTIVNTLTVIVGGLLGLYFKQHISQRFSKLFFQAVGLFTVALGIKMAITSHELLLMVFSLISGAFVGEWLKLDKQIDRLGNFCKRKLKLGHEKFTEGLITAFLLFCAGAMTIVGSINEGLGKGNELLLTKAVMDGFSSIILATTFGVSIALSAIPLLLFQGGLTLLAHFFGASVPEPLITELSAIGGVLLIGVALNILEIKRLNVTNMLPALVIICLLTWAKIHFWPA